MQPLSMSIRSRLLCYSNWSSNFVPAARMSVPILRAAVNANPTSPSELWQAMVDRYDSAQAAQAATITDTNSIVVTDCGIDFVLKVATKLRDKPPLPKANHGAFRKEWRNPFLPPDPDLFVCHLSDTHSLVLNKFNIVPHHGLVITREFHPQEEPLNAEDLQATWDVMQAMPHGGLAYFNCGPVSGASQPHKHLQVIPFSLAGNDDQRSMGHAISAALTAESHFWIEGITEVKTFPFMNYVAKVDADCATGKLLAATHAVLLSKALATVGPRGDSAGPFSFNTIFTREFIMVVPRRADAFGAVSCNSMAYAGSFFVRSAEELEFIREKGPMQILKQVGFARKAAAPLPSVR